MKHYVSLVLLVCKQLFYFFNNKENTGGDLFSSYTLYIILRWKQPRAKYYVIVSVFCRYCTPADCTSGIVATSAPCIYRTIPPRKTPLLQNPNRPVRGEYLCLARLHHTIHFPHTSSTPHVYIPIAYIIPLLLLLP